MSTQDRDDTALYLYCVGEAGDFGRVGVTGIDERFPPFAFACGDLVGVASEVPVADFCGPEAERKLENLEWMSERAVRHERTVEEAFLRVPVLPVRFGTLFSRAEVLRQFLEINQEAIRGFLEATRGHEEWGVKAFLDQSAATKWLAARLADSADAKAPASPGLRYLRERRAQAAAETELHRWVADICTAAAESLRECAEDWRERKIIESAAGDDSAQAVMNAAVLLRRERSADLVARIGARNAEHQARGISFAATGPWPLYSFCPQLKTPQ